MSAVNIIEAPERTELLHKRYDGTFGLLPGVHVDEAIPAAISMAAETNTSIVLKVKDVTITVDSSTDIGFILSDYARGVKNIEP